MNREKQITMSLELAKQMLGKDEAMDMLIKQNFNDEELGIKPKLPKKWEDINCLSGYYSDASSRINPVDTLMPSDSNKNVLPTKELAEAMLALCQLLYLRDIYNDGWEPDWTDKKSKYFICNLCGGISVYNSMGNSHSLSFKNSELVNEFLTNFKDLLEIAKPLL